MSSLTCFNDSNTNNKGEWTNCYSASNNYNFNSPAIMHDGRLWSQWQPDAAVNERIQKQEGINNNWTYRQYLQNNGLKIMNYNNQESCYTLGLDPHTPNSNTPSNNVPHTFKGTFDTQKPGFGYCNSDLKSPYLSREQLNSRLVAPSINLNQLR